MRSSSHAMKQLSPILSTLSLSSSPVPILRPIVFQFTRHAATARRTKKELRVKPAPSMTMTASSPKQTHIIFNPPPSAANPYHTPTLFLPKTDPRYALLRENAAELGLEPAKKKGPIPPPTSGGYIDPNGQKPEKEFHLTERDVEQIRKLRQANPVKYSRKVLAKMFNCEPIFVAMICSLPKETQEKREKVKALIRMRWGKLRREAREDRERRKEDWGRG